MYTVESTKSTRDDTNQQRAPQVCGRHHLKGIDLSMLSNRVGYLLNSARTRSAVPS